MLSQRPRVKRAYHHGNLRQDLVSAALQIIVTHGPAALTLRSVAKRLGVSQTAPYRHFESKEVLLAAVAAEGFAALLAATKAEIATATGPVARFQAIGLGYVRFAIEHPAFFMVMYGPRPNEFNVGPVADAGRAAYKLLIDSIVDCQQAGRAPAGDPTLIAVKTWSLAHGLAMLHINGLLPRRIDAAELRALATHITVFLEAPSGRGEAPAGRRGSPAKP